MMQKPLVEDDHVQLWYADTFAILAELPDTTADIVFADPPYFLSNGGSSCRGGKRVSVNKGDWDKGLSLNERHAFNRQWIKECRRILKPTGTIWISGTFHNIFSVGMALEQEGFTILNNIVWQKTNPPPNLGCRQFTHSTETVLWAKKTDVKGHYFDYAAMKKLNGGKQMKDVWSGSLTPKSEKAFGYHPTQKPEYLLKRIILASTRPNDIVLDPFCSSGTTGVVAKRLGRQFIGIDSDPKAIELTRKRLEHTEWNQNIKTSS
jgi:site-specific DNA-methyltransferase (adenine-specific)